MNGVGAGGPLCQPWQDLAEDVIPTRNIYLTEHLDRLIESEVDSGRSGDGRDVVREGPTEIGSVDELEPQIDQL